MTSGIPLSPAEKEYLRKHQDEWPSVLAYRVSQLFGTARTERGIRNAMKKLKEEQASFQSQPLVNSPSK